MGIIIYVRFLETVGGSSSIPSGWSFLLLVFPAAGCSWLSNGICLFGLLEHPVEFSVPGSLIGWLGSSIIALALTIGFVVGSSFFATVSCHMTFDSTVVAGEFLLLGVVALAFCLLALLVLLIWAPLVSVATGYC